MSQARMYFLCTPHSTSNEHIAKTLRGNPDVQAVIKEDTPSQTLVFFAAGPQLDQMQEAVRKEQKSFSGVGHEGVFPFVRMELSAKEVREFLNRNFDTETILD